MTRASRHGRLRELVIAATPPADIAHDQHHVDRVYSWAMKLAAAEAVDQDLAGAAALVHDLAAIPKNDPARAQGGERAAVLAAEPLRAAGYSEPESTAIVEAVRTSSWSRGLAPTSKLGAILQDADRLDGIGAIGIARVFACAQSMSRPDRPGRFYHPDDPFAVTGRKLDDRLQAVDHFAAKLLTLAEGMHCALAREEARARHEALVAFLAELRREISA